MEPTQLNGAPCTRISIFLNVFDVHVNRSPITGVIKSAVYKKGQFGNAMAPASADDNEQNTVTMEGDGMTVVFKQIAGLLARRIVFNHKPGEKLLRGQRVGLIKFGSRTDVIFPQPAEISVKLGDRVKGGESILAKVAVTQIADRHPSGKNTGCVPMKMPSPMRRWEDQLPPAGKNRMRKGMYILPSLFTAANIGAGYYALSQTLQGTRRSSGILIMLRWRLALPWWPTDLTAALPA